MRSLIESVRPCDGTPQDSSNRLIEVFLAYSDRLLKQCGGALWGAVRRELGGEGLFRYSEWKFELLAHPSLCRIAIAEARTADLVIIALRRAQPLPAPIREWIDHAGSSPRLRSQALVILLGRDPEPEATEWPDHDWLAVRSQQGGLAVLVQEVELTPAGPRDWLPAVQLKPGRFCRDPVPKNGSSLKPRHRFQAGEG
jgi:hypothetical protein